MSTYMEVYSLLTVNSNPVFDSEKVKETSFGVNDSNSESLATISMWTFRNFSISLMLTPPLPIMDAIRSSFTITLTRFADKISTSALESYFLYYSLILSSANFSIPAFSPCFTTGTITFSSPKV